MERKLTGNTIYKSKIKPGGMGVPPLLYIFLLCAVLILMLYWVLYAIRPPRRNSRTKVPDKRRFSFESAQELFKYLEAEEFYLPLDTIKLVKIESGHLRAYWRLSQNEWQEIMRQLNKSDGREIILRLHQDERILKGLDAPVKAPVGGHDWEFLPNNFIYVSLGIKSKDNYIPLLLSEKI
jgi:hypothetical protein